MLFPLPNHQIFLLQPTIHSQQIKAVVLQPMVLQYTIAIQLANPIGCRLHLPVPFTFLHTKRDCRISRTVPTKFITKESDFPSTANCGTILWVWSIGLPNHWGIEWRRYGFSTWSTSPTKQQHHQWWHLSTREMDLDVVLLFMISGYSIHLKCIHLNEPQNSCNNAMDKKWTSRLCGLTVLCQ